MSEAWKDFRFALLLFGVLGLLGAIFFLTIFAAAITPWLLLVSVPLGLTAAAAVVAGATTLIRNGW